MTILLLFFFYRCTFPKVLLLLLFQQITAPSSCNLGNQRREEQSSAHWMTVTVHPSVEKNRTRYTRVMWSLSSWCKNLLGASAILQGYCNSIGKYNFLFFYIPDLSFKYNNSYTCVCIKCSNSNKRNYTDSLIFISIVYEFENFRIMHKFCTITKSIFFFFT